MGPASVRGLTGGRTLGAAATLEVICLYADALEFAENMKPSGLDFTFVPVTEAMIDKQGYFSTGHNLGIHAMIVDRVAEKCLDSKSAKAVRARGKNNFEMGSTVRYRTSEKLGSLTMPQALPKRGLKAMNDDSVEQGEWVCFGSLEIFRQDWETA